jgi:hypothetical protein
MNYGEELAYWYLRLNGFFPLSNFVVHRSASIRYTSDIDVLAVRPPHVYEEVGGRPEDWDADLAKRLGFGRLIGIICEVKTGGFDEAKLFREEYLAYAIGRLGLAEPGRAKQIVSDLAERAWVKFEDNSLVAKLFLCSKVHESPRYFTRTLAAIEDFLADRVRRYPLEKYADRMFFPSQLFQTIIEQVHRAIERRPKPARR